MKREAWTAAGTEAGASGRAAAAARRAAAVRLPSGALPGLARLLRNAERRAASRRMCV
ncbi:MAG: hypothetical protein KJ025_08865 [Burkholderiales bacterium]|nr:hypothetical protein [Burkholderiales bacterium]